MSYLFDGINDKITYSHQTGLDSCTAYSISVWAKFATPASGWGRMLSQEDADNGLSFLYPSNTDATPLNIQQTGSNIDRTVDKASVFSTGAWTHIFVAWSTSGLFNIWVNGTQLTSLNYGLGNPDLTITTATGQLFTLGAQSNGGTFWTGRIAEVAAWWGEDLSANTTLIANLAAGWKADDPTNGRTTGLDFYAPLLADADDDSSNAYTGTVSGATLDGDHPTMQTPSQLAYPASDIAVGSWTSTGANLFSVLEDDNDATYIRSSSGSGSDVATVALDAISLPQAGTVTLRVRHKAV